MSFSEAFQFRYNNEGKKNSTKMSLKSTGSTAFPSTSPVVPAPPGQATKSRPKTSRPKPIITEIKEEENTLILTVDKSNPSYEGLRAQLRMWEP